MATEKRLLVVDCMRHLIHWPTSECAMCLDLQEKLNAMMANKESLFLSWISYEIPLLLFCRQLKRPSKEWSFYLEYSTVFGVKFLELAFRCYRNSYDVKYELPEYLVGVLVHVGIETPLKGQFLLNLETLFAELYHVAPAKPMPHNSGFEESSVFVPTLSDESLKLNQIELTSSLETLSKRVLESEFLYPTYSLDLHYKLYKGISVEAHPFTEAFQTHFKNDHFFNTIALILFANSSKSLLKDYWLYVVLSELKQPPQTWFFVPTVLPIMFKKAEFDHAVIENFLVQTKLTTINKTALQLIRFIIFTKYSSVSDPIEDPQAELVSAYTNLKKTLQI